LTTLLNNTDLGRGQRGGSWGSNGNVGGCHHGTCEASSPGKKSAGARHRGPRAMAAVKAAVIPASIVTEAASTMTAVPATALVELARRAAKTKATGKTVTPGTRGGANNLMHNHFLA